MRRVGQNSTELVLAFARYASTCTCGLALIGDVRREAGELDQADRAVHAMREHLLTTEHGPLRPHVGAVAGQAHPGPGRSDVQLCGHAGTHAPATCTSRRGRPVVPAGDGVPARRPRPARSGDRRRGTTAASRQSNDAAAQARTGQPVGPGSRGTPSNIAEPPGRSRLANQLETSCCPAESTLTPNAPARSIKPTVRLVSLRQTSTSIGSSDTDEKELTVTPCMVPSLEATVTTLTPVGNEPIALRKALASMVDAVCESMVILCVSCQRASGPPAR